MRRGRKITPTVGVYPTVFGVFLRYFHPTVYIPRNFTVSFNVSPQNAVSQVVIFHSICKKIKMRMGTLEYK